MKLEKVLTTTEFVLWVVKQPTLGADVISPHEADLGRIVRYAHLMKNLLSLEMFVPCKQNGELAENPKDKLYGDNIQAQFAWSNYKGASRRVLFEGCKHLKWKNGSGHDCERIEIGNFVIMAQIHEGGWANSGIRDIEDLAQQIELIPTDNFYKKIGL